MTNANLIDALVYGGGAPDAELVETLMIGLGPVQVSEALGGDAPTQSIQRCEAFERNSGTSYVAAAPPSPGVLNDGSLPCSL